MQSVAAIEETFCSSPSCNSVGSREDSDRHCKQENFDAALMIDESKRLDRCSKKSRRNEIRENTSTPPKSSTALEIMGETEDCFSASPIKYVLSYRDSDGRRFKDEVVQHMKSLEPIAQKQRDGHILEVHRIVMIQEMLIDATKPLAEQSIAVEQYGPCELTVNSIAIINALNSVIKYWPGLNLNTPSLVIREPFAILYHHREGLKEYADSKSSTQTREDSERCDREQNVNRDMKLLFDFLDFQPSAKKIARERERHNRSRPAVTFEMLWMLYPPGTDVFWDCHGHGSYEGFVVKRTDGGGLALDSASAFIITMWYLDYNGDYIGRREAQTTIQPFTGEKELNSLPVIPCDFYRRVSAGQVSDESKSLRQTFVGYGERFLKLTKRQCVQYSGETYSFPRRSVCNLDIYL